MGGGLGNLQGKNKDNMHRAPEVVEFYQSLMKRDVKSTGGGISGNDINPDARNNMIGEIENRSTHLLAVSISIAIWSSLQKLLIPLYPGVRVRCKVLSPGPSFSKSCLGISVVIKRVGDLKIFCCLW
jgi:hypothetical protein